MQNVIIAAIAVAIAAIIFAVVDRFLGDSTSEGLGRELVDLTNKS